MRGIKTRRKPGSFRRQLAPAGVNHLGAVDEEVLPLLLNRLERDGSARGCPGGRMMDADRAVLNEIVTVKSRSFEESRKREEAGAIAAKKEAQEMSEAPFPFSLLWKAANAVGNAVAQSDIRIPDWSGLPRQIEQLCRGPG